MMQNNIIPMNISSEYTGKITVITCTGDRQICFDKCVEYMERQIRKPDQWIIIDDGTEPTSNIPEWADYYRLDPITNAHTLPRNMRFALAKVKHPKTVIFEDDDYYSKHYIDQIVKPDFDVVGGATLYSYHVQTTKCVAVPIIEHCAFAQMAFSSEIIPLVYRIASIPTIIIDMELWKKVGTVELVGKDLHAKEITGFLLQTKKPLIVSMKAMPGRLGRTTLHDSRYFPDIDYGEVKTWLDEEWAEEDMRFYEQFITDRPKYGRKDLPEGVRELAGIYYVPGGGRRLTALMDSMYRKLEKNRWCI